MVRFPAGMVVLAASTAWAWDASFQLVLASELYLRTRELELRQELALGEGPVITTLASVSGLSPKALGRVMRARRAELIALMGDGSDASWPERFLARVEAMFPRVAFK